MRRLALLLTTALLFMACEKDKEDDDDTDDSGKTPGTIALTVEKLPSVSDPVFAFAEGATGTAVTEASNFNNLAVNFLTPKLAETGVSLGDSVADIKAKFVAATNPSKNFCETVNRALKFYQDASSVDMMQCIFKGLYKDKSEFFDGEEHITAMSMGEGSFKMKFKAAGDATALTGFTSYICKSDSQMMYFNVAIAEEDVTLKSIRETPGGSVGSCSGETVGMVNTMVTSKLNDDGQMVGLKKIGLESTTSCLADDEIHRYLSADITQSDKNFLYSAWQKEQNVNKFYIFTELVDTNVATDPYSLKKVAVGDGAGIVTLFNSEEAEGWNGDTLAIDVVSLRLPRVEDATLPTEGTVAAITFTGDEAWDCSGDVEQTDEIPEALMAACGERFDLDQDPLDCSDL